MDRTGAIFFSLAFLLAAASGVGLYLYLKGMPVTNAETDANTVPVVVATRDMTFGTTLKDEHLKVARFPKDAVPSGSYSTEDSVVTHTTRVFLAEGEPVLRSKLSSIGGGLSLRIPETKRAISVDVNEITGVSGFVLPGDRVDVLVTVDNAKGSNVAVTKTVVQNCEILAAGAKSEEKKKHHLAVQTVTLLVSPSEAEALALGAHQGEIHLVLRNPVDQELMAESATDTRRVLGLYQPRRRTRSVTPKPAPKQEEQKVEEPVVQERKFTIIRNGNITEQTVPVKDAEPETVPEEETEKKGK